MYKEIDLEYFDTADYPKSHPCYSEVNKNVLGKFKDESHGFAISEFVGLRPKLYSYTIGTKEFKKAKGVDRATTKHLLQHKHFKECLLEKNSKV